MVFCSRNRMQRLRIVLTRTKLRMTHTNCATNVHSMVAAPFAIDETRKGASNPTARMNWKIGLGTA